MALKERATWSLQHGEANLLVSTQGVELDWTADRVVSVGIVSGKTREGDEEGKERRKRCRLCASAGAARSEPGKAVY